MFLVDWAVKMRIRPPELETSICDAKHHVSLSTRSVLDKCVYLVTLAMSLFDLQDVRIAIGSLATLDLPMVVDLIGIYGLKGPYCTLTTTSWFLQALSVIPRGSWGDVARRSYHDPMGKSGIVIPEPHWLWAHG
ncbi:DNA-directed RNA polymerase V subunit 1 [Dorcoceras hygrometricum]|uniref:DNA-directed RNA polymerase V subunit 1 n=1 Tax=Dorcoceras hygrometricum TaxID=472368 RepID=A0A2Z7CAT7_9LAMI|nr:DNA-directed RNA polymerase V subunit 1 [Dorcoceras hygrometricum]